MATSKEKKTISVASRTTMARCDAAKSTLEEVQKAQAVLDLKLKKHALAVSAAFFTA